MKTKVMILAYSLSLALILAASLLLILPAGAEIKAGVKFDPDLYIWDSVIPDWWKATISLTGGYKAADINESTVLLEYTVPANTTLSGVVDKYFDAYFDGQAVYNILWVKLYHMGAGLNPKKPYRVRLIVTGNLIDSLGGLSFAGEGVIAVKFPYGPPPPPPAA